MFAILTCTAFLDSCVQLCIHKLYTCTYVCTIIIAMQISLTLQGSLDPEPVLLEGNSAYGRFGFAVANVGDLDVDGLEGSVHVYAGIHMLFLVIEGR